MTTVIDPLGSPVVVFNKDGLSIVELDVEENDPLSVNLPVNGHTILLITTSVAGSTKSVKLLNDVNVGDVVEFKYVTGSGVFTLYDKDDNAINTLNGPGLASSNRKMPDGSWFRW